MLNDLYNKRILKLAANISHIGELEEYGAKSTKHSRLCGSQVTVYLKLGGDGRISDFAHQVKACALGQTSSSVMARHIIGSTPEELHDVAKTMCAMLHGNGSAPTGKWCDLKVLEPVRDFPNRHASVMLTFEAVEDCLRQIGQTA